MSTVKKRGERVVEVQRMFCECVCVCARNARQRVRERAKRQSYVLLTSLNYTSYKESWFKY